MQAGPVPIAAEQRTQTGKQPPKPGSKPGEAPNSKPATNQFAASARQERDARNPARPPKRGRQMERLWYLLPRARPRADAPIAGRRVRAEVRIADRRVFPTFVGRKRTTVGWTSVRPRELDGLKSVLQLWRSHSITTPLGHTDESLDYHRRRSAPSASPHRSGRKRRIPRNRRRSSITPAVRARHRARAEMAGLAAARRRQLQRRLVPRQRGGLRAGRHGDDGGRQHARPRPLRRAGEPLRRLPAGQHAAERLHLRPRFEPTARCTATDSPRCSWPSATACRRGPSCATNCRRPSKSSSIARTSRAAGDTSRSAATPTSRSPSAR